MMNTLELNQCDLVELNSAEQSRIEGGSWGEFVVGLALLAATNWGDIREGWEDGAKGQARY